MNNNMSIERDERLVKEKENGGCKEINSSKKIK